MKKSILLLLSLTISAILWAGGVDTLSIHSHQMGKTIKNIVIKPKQYIPGAKYPVVYILHGYGDNYKSWINNIPEIIQEADNHQFIIVCPDGGKSWYIDSPSLPHSRMESYIIEELIPQIDSGYATDTSRRAITGQSMGGQGALRIAVSHPHRFVAASSLSGAVNLCSTRKIIDVLPADSLNAYSLSYLIGQNDIAGLSLLIDCGQNDFLYNDHIALHHKLMEQKIPHTYIDSNGDHSWKYWRESIPYHFLFFDRQFKK